MPPLTRADLLAGKRARCAVEVPERGTVTLQAPTAAEYLEYQEWLLTLPEHSLAHLTRVVAMTAVGEDDKPLLTDEDCRSMDHQTLALLARAALDLIRVVSPTEVMRAKGES